MAPEDASTTTPEAKIGGPMTYADHSKRMHEEHGHGLNQGQHSAVYSYAWQQGHAYGFSEVETYYIELAEMAQRVIAGLRGQRDQ